MFAACFLQDAVLHLDLLLLHTCGCVSCITLGILGRRGSIVLNDKEKYSQKVPWGERPGKSLGNDISWLLNIQSVQLRLKRVAYFQLYGPKYMAALICDRGECERDQKFLVETATETKDIINFETETDTSLLKLDTERRLL